VEAATSPRDPTVEQLREFVLRLLSQFATNLVDVDVATETVEPDHDLWVIRGRAVVGRTAAREIKGGRDEGRTGAA
jgi:hypothetical protein